MLNIADSNSQKPKNYEKYIVVAISALALSASILSLISNEYKLTVIFLCFPFFVFLVINFEKYYEYYLIFFLFFGMYFYWPLRLQFILVLSIITLFFFFLNSKSKNLNDFSIPKSIKISSVLLIASVFTSELFSVHLTLQSLYFSFLFVIFISTGYIFFRSVKNAEKIESFLKFFILSFSFTGLIIIFQILLTGNIRSVGFAGYAIIDFSVISLLILLFRFFILKTSGLLMKVSLVITIIILITTQSRFAWLGFILSFLYGIILCYTKSGEVKTFLKKRMPLLIVLSLILGGIILMSGLNNIILKRFTEIDFNFFSKEDDKVMVANSLETRLLIWIVAYNAFIQNPITGVGYMMFSEVSEHYNVVPQMLFDDYVYGLDAHTTFYNFLVETGIIGFSAFLIFISIIFLISFKSIGLSREYNDKSNSLILNILVFFIFVQSIYSGAFTFGQNAFAMYIIFGITAGNYVLLKNKYAHVV